MYMGSVYNYINCRRFFDRPLIRNAGREAVNREVTSVHGWSKEQKNEQENNNPRVLMLTKLLKGVWVSCCFCQNLPQCIMVHAWVHANVSYLDNLFFLCFSFGA